MKKLGTLILGLIIGALAMYFYCCNQEKTEVAMAPIKPPGVITEAQGKILDAAFNSRHKLISDSIVDRPDNRSAWWSLEDMRNYLDYAQNQTAGLNYTMNGVRVYLGAHPNEKGQVGYTTIFIVPTGDPTPAPGSSNFAAAGNGDIPGGDPFNGGDDGQPPSANYPQ